jgi:hypothetical protein
LQNDDEFLEELGFSKDFLIDWSKRDDAAETSE